jgi:hypothetical protein
MRKTRVPEASLSGCFSPPSLPGDQRHVWLHITDGGDPHFLITEYFLPLQQDRKESAWD